MSLLVKHSHLHSRLALHHQPKYPTKQALFSRPLIHLTHRPLRHHQTLIIQNAYTPTTSPGNSSRDSSSGSDEDFLFDDSEQQPYVPVDFGGGPLATEPFPTLPPPAKPSPDVGTFWGLLVLCLTYLHHSTTGFALPALLPIISEDLHLTDSQGALLTAGYTVLYALALIPMGLLADRTDRPRLLTVGIVLWSGLTVLASNARSFNELLFTRIGFAAAQATQNPICFSLIPDLFPNGKTSAMAIYNSAIYAGRALSFAALIIAGQLGVPQGIIGDIGYTLVPLDKVDLSLVSVLYMQGDFAAVTPVYTYALDDDDEDGVAIESAFSAWRQLLTWLGPPGLVMAVLCLLTVDEPREGKGFLGDPFMSSRFLSGLNKSELPVAPALKDPVMPRTVVQPPKVTATSSTPFPTTTAMATTTTNTTNTTSTSSVTDNNGKESIAESLVKLKILLANPAFVSLTAASALNDVGSWALVSWQATFYQRVYQLTPDTYAPLLAVVIPIGGIIGGVGAGLSGDWLTKVGARGLLTSGASIAAAPVIAVSLLAPDYKQSFAALLVGFALSEAWRAPAAIAVREISPPSLGSTASAAHLCIRNLVGGMGPVAVAFLSGKVGLQLAMLLVPTCYLASGLAFLATELLVSKEKNEGSSKMV